MTKPSLYYALFSPPSRACMLTAKLIGLDVELKFLDFAKQEHLSEEFIKLNPLHQIPVFVDEDEPYSDSHAILAYMVSKYASSDALYPKDLSQRAKVDQRMYFECGVLFPVIQDIAISILYGGETDYKPKTIESCGNAYGSLEKFLENQSFVVGNNMTIADISINTTLITLHRLIPIEKEKYPNIIGWMERMKVLPGNDEINETGADQAANRIKSILVENKSKSK